MCNTSNGLLELVILINAMGSFAAYKEIKEVDLFSIIGIVVGKSFKFRCFILFYSKIVVFRWVSLKQIKIRWNQLLISKR